MSIMPHLNEQSLLQLRRSRALPDGLLTRPDKLRLCEFHIDQLVTLFEILCDSQAEIERLATIDLFIKEASQEQALARVYDLGELGTRSRAAFLVVLQRWREDIAPQPVMHSRFADPAFADPPFADPVDHDPSDTRLDPSDCAA